MTKTEFNLLLQLATQDKDIQIYCYFDTTRKEPYWNIHTSYYAESPVYLYVNLKLIQRNHIPEIVELAKEKHREAILRMSNTNKPVLGSLYTHDRLSPLWYDTEGNLIPISDTERGFLVSLAMGDHSAWRPYIDYLSDTLGLDLQPKLMLHYLQQHERIMQNAATTNGK